MKQNSIILWGDSLVEYFPIQEMYKGPKRILNRGVAGNTTYDVIRRVKRTANEITPEQVMIWVGTNDFMPFVPNNTEAEIVKRIIQIAELNATMYPDAQIMILSLLPINQSSHPKICHDWLAGKDNDKLKRTNESLKEQCAQKSYLFLNLFDLLLDESGQLRIDCTVEGLHINDAGYEIVFNALKPYLESVGN